MNYNNNNGNNRFGNNPNRYDNGYQGRPHQVNYNQGYNNNYNDGYGRQPQGYQGQPRHYAPGYEYPNGQYSPRRTYNNQGAVVAPAGQRRVYRGQGAVHPSMARFNQGPGARPGFGSPNQRPKFKQKSNRAKTAAELKREVTKLAREAKIEATYEAVNKAFPLAFNKYDIKPLTVDVHELLFKHFNVEQLSSESPVRKSALRVFLSKYIRSNNYNLSCIKYKKRFNLDGTVACDLTEQELEYHKAKIKPVNRPKRPVRKNKFQNNAPRHGQRPNYNYGGVPNQMPHSRSFFHIESEVELMNGKRAIVKEMLGDKLKVQLLENGAVITVNQFQCRAVR